MNAEYTEEPLNFGDIDPYVITDRTTICEGIIQAEKCFLYDTCFLINQLRTGHPEYVFDYIKRCRGVIIISRCIIMELCSADKQLSRACVEYIKKAHDSGIAIYILYEENLFQLLGQCFSLNETINGFLSWAVKVVKKPTSTITKTLKSNKSLCDNIFKKDYRDGTLYDSFFQSVRQNKEKDDDLGEEMLAICVHILANIPEKTEMKYLVLSDDKGAISTINKAMKNSVEQLRKESFSAMTTPKLAQLLYNAGIINNKEQIRELLATAARNDELLIVGIGEYDLDNKTKRYTCDALADMIMKPNALHIVR